ncbi:MAG: TolC family protein [Gemmatimonadetes bacterium]|nr:TolC family protein [Gemmatimonadota bacterium]
MNRPRLRPAAWRTAVAIACIPVAGQAQDTLRLADLQAAAVARDPRGAQVKLIRDQAALRLANIRGERLPSLGVNAQAQHQSDVTSVPLPGAIMPFKDTYDANVGLRLRLFDPSRTPRRAVEEAQATEAEARVGATTFAQRLAVNDAWFMARSLEAQRQVVEAALTDLDAQLRLARERVGAGAALPSDTALLVAERLRRRQSLDEVDANRATALALLADLTGRAIGGNIVFAEADLAARARTARDSVDAIRQRPEYAVYQASRLATQAREDALRAQDKPRVSAFTRTGYGRPGLNMLSRAFDTYWLAGIQLEWAPFDWGTARREREAIAIQRDVVASEERAFADRLRRSVLADLAAMDRLERSLADDATIIELRERVLRETRIRHTEGVVTVAELIDRDTDLQVARLALATHRVELDQARARFLTTIGLEVR